MESKTTVRILQWLRILAPIIFSEPGGATHGMGRCSYWTHCKVDLSSISLLCICSVVSNSLWLHGLQYIRLSCSLSRSNSCPLSRLHLPPPCWPTHHSGPLVLQRLSLVCSHYLIILNVKNKFMFLLTYPEMESHAAIRPPPGFVGWERQIGNNNGLPASEPRG